VEAEAWEGRTAKDRLPTGLAGLLSRSYGVDLLSQKWCPASLGVGVSFLCRVSLDALKLELTDESVRKRIEDGEHFYTPESRSSRRDRERERGGADRVDGHRHVRACARDGPRGPCRPGSTRPAVARARRPLPPTEAY
jgi:hypothetical protein